MKIGCHDSHQLSLDLDESLSNVLQQQQQSSGNLLSSSPPSGRTSPPMPTTPQLIPNQEPLELQIDYWPIIKPGDKDKSQNKSSEQSKNSIKSTFRNLQVSHTLHVPNSFIHADIYFIFDLSSLK